MNIKDYFNICLKLDLNLETQTSGNFRVNKTHYKIGDNFQLIPQSYQAFLMGFEPKSIALEGSFNYYELIYGNERIMSNDGTEMFEHYVPFLRAKGNVLVGGLGLGFITNLFADKDNVESITIIEISQDVINICGFSNEKVKIIKADFYSFIRENNLLDYDYIYIDTYTSGSGIYPELIIPTRKYLLENYPNINFDFWQEDQFKAQYLLDCKKKLNI